MHLTTRLILALLLSSAALPALAACPPAGQDKASLQALKGSGFVVADAERRVRMANALLDCLGDPDPTLRDGIAYEALSTWMRADAFTPAQLRTLRDGLVARLVDDDADGFRKPFAALVLSEVARTDRIKPWMTPAEREAMVDAAVRYVGAVNDYRGYSEAEGWRHGVAHGADWLMQLSLNPALQRAQLQRILQAVAVQVMPASGHAYVFGESERLARPVLYASRRGLLSEAEWVAWFKGLRAALGPMPADHRAAWLGRMHDLTAFYNAIYVEADASQEPAIAALKPAVLAAMRNAP